MFKIDKSVPTPDPTPDRSAPIPLSKLEVGESILFPNDRRQSIQANASRLKGRTDKVFTIKKVDEDNARIWRIA